MMPRLLSLLPVLFLPLLVADNIPAPGRAILWRAPQSDIDRDLKCGPRSCDQAPVPPFRFTGGDTGGTAPKVMVVDGKGRNWSVKFGAEVIPECFGSRFLTALGYVAEPTYFVASGKIDEIPPHHGARRIVKADGSFTRARFQARDLPDFEFVKGEVWGWNQNPFQGTHELAGLKIVMMLLSNWDAKDAREGTDSNNAVFRTSASNNEWLYSTYDWGASLGRWGGVFRRNQSDCVGYRLDSRKFVKAVRGNTIEWGYSGKHDEDVTAGITVDDVRWLLPHLAPLGSERLQAALKASGATDRQAACWAQGMEERIGQLQAAIR